MKWRDDIEFPQKRIEIQEGLREQLLTKMVGKEDMRKCVGQDKMAGIRGI